MSWRKISAMLLVVLMTCSLLLLAGCESTDSEETNKDSSEQSENSSNAETDKGYYTAEDYLADPSLFVPVWADEWQPPAEMLDFEEKWKSFFTPNGRMMSMIHRADSNIYYPENSIEAVLSCIAAGVDMIEMDVVMTKDKIPVLMHDPVVTRTTNVIALRDAGAVGLPESDYVADWTLEQLRRLRLVMEKDNGVEVTNYVIPTLEDLMMVAADRIFVYMDCDATEYEFDWELDFYPLIKKHNAYRSIFIPNDYSSTLTIEHMGQLVDTIEKDSGYRAAFQIQAGRANIEDITKMIEENNWPKMLRYSEYSEDAYQIFKPYFGKYRVCMNALNPPHDKVEQWKMMHEQGVNFLHVDDYLSMSKYIAETHFQ